MTCQVCGAPIHARGRCRGCYDYWHRTGRDRTAGRVLRVREMALVRELEKRALVPSM